MSVCNLVNTWFPRCSPEGISYFFRTPAMHGNRQPRMSDNWTLFEYVALFLFFVILMVIICEKLTFKYSFRALLLNCLTFFIPNCCVCPCKNNTYNNMPPFCLYNFDDYYNDYNKNDNIDVVDSEENIDINNNDDEECFEDEAIIQYCCKHASLKNEKMNTRSKKRSKCTKKSMHHEPDLIRSTNRRKAAPQFHVYTPTCLLCTKKNLNNSCNHVKTVRNKSRASRQ